MNEAIKHIDFMVLCGHRGKKDQDSAFLSGNSKLRYPKSKHNSIPSTAIDLSPYPLDWDDINSFCFLAGFIMGTAKQLGVELEWGGHWKKFLDYPHYQIKKK